MIENITHVIFGLLVLTFVGIMLYIAIDPEPKTIK